MAISPDEIAQVRDATDIVALIGESVALKRVGQRWMGLCPFHGEKSPSFAVNAEIGRYYCFGCRASGDQITWVQETQHLDFMDALRQLADRSGIVLHDDGPGGSGGKEKQVFLSAMDEAVKWYHQRLLEAPDARPAREYLRTRGINGEVARAFQLGWAPDAWDALTSALQLSPAVLEGTGLGFVNRGGRAQDAMRGRIIFPIFDVSNRAIGVGGRILPALAERPDGRVEAKYKNSPETAIYSKRRTLYALNFAKEDVIRSGEIIVCEGYTDVIAFFGAGLPRAVATCGTALGEEHFRTMKNFARRIVLAYDADAAGQSAAESVYQWERQHEVDVAVARFPGGLDPAELAQRDPEALRAAVRDAVPFLQFRLERVLDAANLTTAEGRARAGEAALRVLLEHPSEIVRDQYIVTVADRLRLEVATLRSRIAEIRRTPSARVSNETPPVAAPRFEVSPLPRPGQEALRIALNRPRDIVARLAPALFVHEVQRQLCEGIVSGRDVNLLLDEWRNQGRDEVVAAMSALVVEELDREYSAADINGVMNQLLRAAVGEGLRQVERDLREGSLTPDVAMATVRDVKYRLELLDAPERDEAETQLREWLIAREGLVTS